MLKADLQTPGDCSPGDGALEGRFERPCGVLLGILHPAAESGGLGKCLRVAYHSECIREPYLVEVGVQALSLKLELTEDRLRSVWFTSKQHWKEQGTHVLSSAPVLTSDPEVKC